MADLWLRFLDLRPFELGVSLAIVALMVVTLAAVFWCNNGTVGTHRIERQTNIDEVR